jgi:hypothetical protein
MKRPSFYVGKKLTKKQIAHNRKSMGAVVLIQTCNPSCADEIPDMAWVNGCNITTRSGGIPRLTWLKCDPNMVLPFPNGWENVDNVKWAICQRYLYVTGDLLGQKPKGSFVKRRLSSCAPETTISGTKTIAFQDFNADTVDLIDFEFWTAIVANKAFLKFGYITCDERWYQYAGEWDIEVDEVNEDTKDGKSFWDGTVSMATADILVPIQVPGILAAIKAITSTTCY